MSAFICNNSHLTALAVFANTRRIADWCGMKDPDVQKIGQVLLDENVRSVNHRYRENIVQVFEVCPWASLRHFTPIEIIKACHCLDYQSCEHDAWPHSLAHKLVQNILGEATRMLPGYTTAAWEIRPPTGE